MMNLQSNKGGLWICAFTAVPIVKKLWCNYYWLELIHVCFLFKKSKMSFWPWQWRHEVNFSSPCLLTEVNRSQMERVMRRTRSAPTKIIMKIKKRGWWWWWWVCIRTQSSIHLWRQHCGNNWVSMIMITISKWKVHTHTCTHEDHHDGSDLLDRANSALHLSYWKKRKLLCVV